MELVTNWLRMLWSHECTVELVTQVASAMRIAQKRMPSALRGRVT